MKPKVFLQVLPELYYEDQFTKTGYKRRPAKRRSEHRWRVWRGATYVGELDRDDVACVLGEWLSPAAVELFISKQTSTMLLDIDQVPS